MASSLTLVLLLLVGAPQALLAMVWIGFVADLMILRIATTGRRTALGLGRRTARDAVLADV